MPNIYRPESAINIAIMRRKSPRFASDSETVVKARTISFTVSDTVPDAPEFLREATGIAGEPQWLQARLQ
jgi:hypothetical protein